MNTKKKKFWDYLMESLTGFCSLALAILFFFSLYKIKEIWTAVSGIISILMPMIYGLVIAFILAPVCKTYTILLDRDLPKFKDEAKRAKTVNSAGVALTIFTAIIIVYILLVLIIPQLIESIMAIVYNMDEISNSVVNWGNNLFGSKPELQQQFQELSAQIGELLSGWVQETLMPKLQEMLGTLSEGIFSVLLVLKNIVIGLIISVYLLNNRAVYSAQTKKVLYSLASPVWANRIMRLTRETRDIFSGFVMGKLLDSLIIGIICFICLTIFRMPYAVLISTIVGVTNIIPYFGPFFGAIPSTFLILTVSPLQALYFVIFILILQQVDGNIIGPKILGNSTGLASFWVLFSLLLFGGMWGVVGMVVGVPLFAIIYDISSQAIAAKLAARKMPAATRKYGDLDHIDPATGDFIMKDGTVLKTEMKIKKKDLEESD